MGGGWGVGVGEDCLCGGVSKDVFEGGGEYKGEGGEDGGGG